MVGWPCSVALKLWLSLVWSGSLVLWVPDVVGLGWFGYATVPLVVGWPGLAGGQAGGGTNPPRPPLCLKARNSTVGSDIQRFK